jgi:ABC-type transport system involved in Fe-S cluster assembly fused permease/ATPase subunit
MKAGAAYNECRKFKRILNENTSIAQTKAQDSMINWFLKENTNMIKMITELKETSKETYESSPEDPKEERMN